MFFVLVVFGLVLIFSGESWFSVWLGFEITLIGFLPMFRGGSIVVEGLFKYFLVQAGGSGVFALSFLLPDSLGTISLFILGLFMKLGVFPFHGWIPMVMSSLTWAGCLLLVTVQKVGPLFVVCIRDFLTSGFLLIFSVFSVLVGGIIGYNQSYIRSLIAYSSIRHTGWLIISFVCSFRVFIIYLFVYFFLLRILFSLFSSLHLRKVIYRGVGFKFWGVLSLLILRLSGIPPFSMFYLKMGVVYYIISSLYFYVPFVLFGSIFSIYYYLTFIVPSLSIFWHRGGGVGIRVSFGFLLRFVLPILFFF